MGKLVDTVGEWIVNECTDGMPRPFGDDLVQQFSSEPKDEVEEALAELDEDGLVTLSHVLGPSLPRVRPTPELFRVYDPAVTGDEPDKDAIVLAQYLVDDPSLGNIAALHQKSGWPKRRFNPALSQLMPLFDQGRFSETDQNEYPTRSVSIGPKERVRLRRFIEAAD